MEKATFDDLIRLKLRRAEQRETPIEIKVESLGKALIFIAPNKDQQLDFISGLRSAGSISNAYEPYRKFVYDCCPALHDPKLHDELGAVDPYDAIDILFPPKEVIDIGDAIADKFLTVTSEIKN